MARSSRNQSIMAGETWQLVTVYPWSRSRERWGLKLPFSFFHPKMSDHGIMTPVARVSYPTQLPNSAQPRNSLRDTPTSLFLGDSRSCRVFSINRHSSNLENGRSHSLLLGYNIGFCQRYFPLCLRLINSRHGSCLQDDSKP